MIYQQTAITSAICLLFVVVLGSAISPSTTSLNSTNTNSTTTTCETRHPRCATPTLSYPFGFSDACPIRLNCSRDGHVTIGEFEVQNVTADSILVGLPPNCTRGIGTARPLFGPNYALKMQNGLLLSNCSKPHADCVIPKQLIRDHLNLGSCTNTSCYSGSSGKDVDFLTFADVHGTGCARLVSSIAAEPGKTNSTVSLQFRIAQLGWWVRGNCRGSCSDNATCSRVQHANGTGFRCSCVGGFYGDGYAGAGASGCLSVSACGPSSLIHRQCGKNGKAGILAGGIVACASVLAVLVAVCFFIQRRSTALKTQQGAKQLLCSAAAGTSCIPLIPYREIERATHSFSGDHRLGTGAYGTVYAGKLQNGEWVAVKKIKHPDNESADQVVNEINLVSSVSHPNLIRLLGCCMDKGEQILVYEFMPNGTLSQHLQRERGESLPWTIRLTIAAETAHAIAYLHSEMKPPIYHRDVKSSNILLDFNFNSKVADFGLSRFGMTDDSHFSTCPQGTPGYVDPQYHQNFHLSDKSDVYSFGVVLVEIITAMKVVDFSRSHGDVNLAALAIDRIGRGCVDEIIDPFLEPHRDAWTLCSVHRVAELAFRCLAFHRDMRPSMMEVADELEQIRLSRWAPMENIAAGSSVASICSSPYNESLKLMSSETIKKAGVGSQSMSSEKSTAIKEELVKECSPISVHDPWLSERSSPPSTNSLLNNVSK